MTKCISCGAELKEGKNFCGYCGNRVTGAGSAVSEDTVIAAPQPAEPIMQQKAVESTGTLLSAIILKGPRGELKNCPVGFNWPIVFLGAFVPLFRKDWLWAVVWYVGYVIGGALIGALIGGLIGGLMGYALMNEALIAAVLDVIVKPIVTVFVFVIAVGINIIIAFRYNEVYIKKLLKKGYLPFDENSRYTLRVKGIIY